ncbi:mannitol dehydrogenase family protein [Microbacterium timonense]|uniref:mannitol dehydrogenase family protein n=1 Tax=Microbacterium timonense TaxID=2086576 RepID=UPI00190EF080|nr:mannitol dehydrogenase family protein [Microbacterium timonense]
MTGVRLDSAALAGRGGVSRPRRVRIVHLGLGNFHRAHQAWYTAHAADAEEWGIAAFTGRSPVQARLLQAQDGLYTLTVRAPRGDAVEVVPSILEAHDASRLDRLIELLSDPAVALVTLTVTEAGYRLRPGGTFDADDPLAQRDLEELVHVLGGGGTMTDAALQTPLGRLLIGLEARRRTGAGPIAIVPCDNIPANGSYLARGLLDFAGRVSPDLAAWMMTEVAFVSTSVDRITPRADADDEAIARAGWIDASPVVTEPFSDWVLSGAFPAGRPAWETAGARLVDDIEPWENRKLWLLNGAHSILAFTGLARGHETVASAISDPVCRGLVEDFWAEAVVHLPHAIEHQDYRRDLVERFANPRIQHRLHQIAGDATAKVRFRFAPVAERTVRNGAVPRGSARALASWIAAVRADLLPSDATSEAVASAAASADDVTALLHVVSPLVAAHPRSVAAVRAASSAVAGAVSGAAARGQR